MTQREGLRSSCALVVRIALLASGACSRSTESAASIAAMTVGPSILLDTSGMLVRFDSTLSPLSVRSRPNGFAAVDPKVQQVLLLDSALTVVARVGSAGSGPGELRGVVRVEPWHRGLAVGEGANARISLFTADGAFRGVVQRPYRGGPFSISDRGVLLTPAQVPPHLVESGSINDPTPSRIGRRPPAIDPQDERHTGRDLIVRQANGQVIIVENRNGALLEVRDDGTVTTQFTLPEPMLSAIQDHRRRRVALFESRASGRVFAAPLLKDVAAHGDRLILSSSVAPFCLLIVDLERRSVRPVQSIDPTLNDALCRTESIALSSLHLVAATDDSLLRFRSPLLPKH